jgi:hypothetical protein
MISEQVAGEGMDKAMPFLKGSIYPIVFTFITVLCLSLPSPSALRYTGG